LAGGNFRQVITMTNDVQKNDGSQPGVMGDGTEEQNLGQPGHPEARITEAEVKDAFGKGDKPARGDKSAT
jgi:hypothetical protein